MSENPYQSPQSEPEKAKGHSEIGEFIKLLWKVVILPSLTIVFFFGLSMGILRIALGEVKNIGSTILEVASFSIGFLVFLNSTVTGIHDLFKQRKVDSQNPP